MVWSASGRGVVARSPRKRNRESDTPPHSTCYHPPVIPFDEALSSILDRTPRLELERVPLPDAAGRVLAEDVVADLDVPPFDTTAMDGWAVRGDEVQAVPVEREVAGVVG